MSDTTKPAPEGGRYYTPEGVLIEGATARTAKRDGLYPSVTTLAYELAEPYGLRQARERLIAQEAGDDALAIARDDYSPSDGYGSDTWCDRMRRQAVEDWQEAAQRGRDIHAHIAEYLNFSTRENRHVHTALSGETYDFLDTVAEVIHVERVMVNHVHGYAGTCDLVCLLDGKLCISVIDFKTQRVKQGRPLWYMEWRRQLAAYSRALTSGGYYPSWVALTNVVISTHPDTEGQVWLKTYTHEEIKQAWRAVRLAAALWWNARKVADSELPPGVRELLT